MTLKKLRGNLSPLTPGAMFLVLSSACMLVIIMFLVMRRPEYLYGMKFEVRVINGFTSNSSLPLVIWCSSRDNKDMGGRALQEGDDYSWSSETSSNFFFWGSILSSNKVDIFCSMKWDKIRKKFDAFLVSRDSSRCNPTRLCLWLVKEDGFYFSNDGLHYRKDFSWTT